MRTPVTRSIFDERGGRWDGAKSRRKVPDMLKIEVGQTDLSNYRVGLKKQVGVMGEVLLRAVVDKADGRRGLLNCDKPQTAC